MPTVPVPRYEQQSVDRPGPVNVANIQQRANGLDTIADFGNNLSNVIVQEKVKYDDGIFQDAVLKLNAGMQGIQTAQNQLEGNNALGSAPKAVGQYHELASELSATIPANRQRDWQRQMESGAIQLSGAAERHEYGQMQQYRAGQQQAIVETGIDASKSLYADPAALDLNNARTKNSIETYGLSQGWSQEQIQAEVTKFSNRSDLAATTAFLGSDYKTLILKTGEPADVGGTTRVSSTQVVDGTRSIRNNNPGNIEFNDNNSWQGQTGSDGRFAKFETPEHGIRALGRNLLSYGKQGIDTPAEIIGRWAPPGKDGKENDTQAYIKSVCAQLGVKADQPLDLTNADTLANLCNAIMKQENGKVPYSADQVNKGVQAALGFTQLDSVSRITQTSYFNRLDSATQAQFLRQAEAMQKQQQAQYRTQLDDTVRDASAAYMRGVEYPNMPGQADFVSAYGYREGVQRYQDLENQRVAGQYIGAFRTLPTDSITAAVKSLTPEVGDGEGYASRANAYDLVKSAAAAVIQQRIADPIQFSLSTGQSQPIDLSNQDSFGKSIAMRSSQVTDLAKTYNTPLSFFSKEEANTIGIFFRDAPVSQQSDFLDTIRQNTGGGKVYMSALQQISASAPSAAVAGIIMDKSGGVVAEKNWFNPDISVSPGVAAQNILAGAAARKGSKEAKGMVMPKETDMRSQFSDMVKDAFAGDAQGASMAYEVAKDYYAGVMQQKGDVSGELDNDTWKQAINVSTGGVYDYNGMGNVLLPWGMSESQFDKQVNQAWKAQVEDAGIKAPAGQYGLQSHGDSQYLVKLGSGYLLKKDGTPVIIDVTQSRQRFIGGIPQ